MQAQQISISFSYRNFPKIIESGKASGISIGISRKNVVDLLFPFGNSRKTTAFTALQRSHCKLHWIT
jgi:hypothetical protein